MIPYISLSEGLLFRVYLSWQITDGRSRCGAICDERFWLQRWKFANSKVQLRLQLQSEVNPLVVTGFLRCWYRRCVQTHSDSSYFEISAVSPCLTHSRVGFWAGGLMNFINVSSKMRLPLESAAHSSVQSCCRGLLGLFGVSAFIWNVSFHICVFPPRLL